MPEGQFSGARSKYKYEADDGTVVALLLDETLGDIEGNGLTKRASGDVTVNKPLNFKPRVVFWKGILNSKEVRKEIVCNHNGTLYRSSSPVALTIDGVDGETTGRRGEKLSYC